MPVFKYEMRDRMGNLVRSTAEAPMMRDVMRDLLSKGCTIVWIKPQSSALLDQVLPALRPMLKILAVAALIIGGLLAWKSLH
jgi:type II secretory pathway component PulF